MIRSTLIAAALVAALALPAGAAASPPSFALWLQQRDNRLSKIIDPIGPRCLDAFHKDDQKIGECVVTGFLGIVSKPGDHGFDRAVAKIARPQAPSCRRAIHSWWVAQSKVSDSFTLYLKGHRHTSITDFARDMHREPLETLSNVSDSAKSRAIRICH
jgi:hypothetical protein